MSVNALYHLQTEREFMASVRRYAEMMGWRVYHTRDSRGSDKGFPDLVLVRRPRVILAELKAERGTLTHEQSEWLAALDGCGVETAVWRPSSWKIIEETLR